jgi:hypothetical protein
MESHITEADKRRIATFLSTPKYERDPEMLVPSEE